MKNIKESDLYPLVEKWLKESHRCFKREEDTGVIDKEVTYSRIDVVGVRDVGGDLSADIEIIAVEVKRKGAPFAKASGQALGYKICANRVYLAVQQDELFSPDEVNIASHLGIGLIQIKNQECIEVLSSPYYKPIERLSLALLENLQLGKCQICDSIFDISNIESYSKVKLRRKTLERAIKYEKGLKFWNWSVAERKRKMGIRDTKDEVSAERRYICPDCIANFFSQFQLKD